MALATGPLCKLAPNKVLESEGFNTSGGLMPSVYTGLNALRTESEFQTVLWMFGRVLKLVSKIYRWIFISMNLTKQMQPCSSQGNLYF